MRPEENIKYKRPTTAVRVRPYLFLYQTQVINLSPGVPTPPLFFRPQGNAAEGNRVTWGWNIRILLRGAARIQFNGQVLNLFTPETLLIDSTKNSAGIDVTEYQITFINGDPLTVIATEQILQIAEL